MLINPNDEEALKRVINYPARGIGATTIDKLSVAANHYKKSIFELLCNLNQTRYKVKCRYKNKVEQLCNNDKAFSN